MSAGYYPRRGPRKGNGNDAVYTRSPAETWGLRVVLAATLVSGISLEAKQAMRLGGSDFRLQFFDFQTEFFAFHVTFSF
jgi:hypothetical protein